MDNQFETISEKVVLGMRLHTLQSVYQMLLHEQPVLTKEYIEKEIAKAERELDALNGYPAPDRKEENK